MHLQGEIHPNRDDSKHAAIHNQPSLNLSSTDIVKFMHGFSGYNKMNATHEITMGMNVTESNNTFFGDYNLDYSGVSGDMSDLYTEWSQEYLANEIKKTFFAYKQTPTAILIALYTLTFLWGFIGNILVIYIFTKNRKMRTVTNSFLVNLAVCDLMVVCICMPFSVANEIYANWIYGDALCKIVNFSQGLSVTSSILTLAVISAERFYAIRRPLRARAFMSRLRVVKIVVTIWCVSALAVLPLVFVRREQIVEKIYTVTISTCMESWETHWLKHMYNFGLLGLLYAAPVMFICVGYLQIGLNLWRHDSHLHASISAAESENARANLAGRRKVAKMLFVMALLFAISWLPYHVLGIVLDFLPEEHLSAHGILLRHIHSYALWFGHANSSINPICYCIMSASFKAAVRLEFHGICCCKRTPFRRRSSFSSMSMSMTLTTSGHRGYTSRVVYKPVGHGNGVYINGLNPSASTHAKDSSRKATGATKGTPDLLKHISTKSKIDHL